ncbi:MAG TPA: hypothetical protein VIF15_10220 [Polyangiaceae bacterium]
MLRRSYAFFFAVLVFLALVLAGGCGDRTGLLVPSTHVPERSGAFCVRADYVGGSGQVTLLVLLDRSLSMDDHGKWAAATAALGAFVKNPGADGIALGLQYMPLGLNDCVTDDYQRPAVGVAPLPGNAPAVAASLARTHPDGDTPMLPALGGVLEYARAQVIADPTRSVAIAIITDGQPDTCNSTASTVAALAASGAADNPPILTFTVGLLNDFAGVLDLIAAAGGTGKAILVTDPATAAQQLVNTLSTLRDTERLCHFAVPPTGGAPVVTGDLAVTFTDKPGGTSQNLSYYGSQAECGGADGFSVDSAAAPTFIALCPALCARAHATPGARIEVTAGCGPGAPDGAAQDGTFEGGLCSGITETSCVASCAAGAAQVTPICVDALWTCPPGSVDASTCGVCPPVPHGCCEPDGSIDVASCINGAWTCPPGGTFFGVGNCKPPAVCMPTLPCAIGQYCAWPDDACGTTRVAGTCQPVPTGCNGGPQACGCDGQVHPSACAAAQQGLDVSTTQGCSTPGGTFACGPLFCDVASSLCEETQDITKAVGGKSWSCVAPPPGCPTGCGCGLCPPCPAGRKCTETCTSDGNGGRTLVCTVL